MPSRVPFRRRDPMVYSEQLGKKRQQSPRYGDTRRWYPFKRPIATSLARTGNDPLSFPTCALSREGARRTPSPDPHPRGLSAPRWPFGSPQEKHACCAGRIPGEAASSGCGPRRPPPGGRRRYRFSWRRASLPPPRRRGNPGRWCSAEWMRAPPGEPLPGIRGRCAISPPWTAETLPPASGPFPSPEKATSCRRSWRRAVSVPSRGVGI
jgi:hypothetical protein